MEKKLIDISYLCNNESELAIKIIKEHIKDIKDNEISIYILSSNSKAIDILEANIEHINWLRLASN